MTLPQSTPDGDTITMRVYNAKEYAPAVVATAPVYLPNSYPELTGYLYVKDSGSDLDSSNDLIVGFTMSGYALSDTASASILYQY